MGVLRFYARGIDLLISGFTFGFKTIGNIWSNLPAILGAAVTGAVNFVIEGVETMVNKAIAGLNVLANGINSILPKELGIKVGIIDDVSLGRMKNPAGPVGTILPEWENNRRVEGYLDSVGDRADARRAGINARNAESPIGDEIGGNPSTAPAGADGKGDKAKEELDKLAEIKKKYDEFFADLKREADIAGMLPLQAEQYNKELELRKILGDGNLENARELSALEKQGIANELYRKNLNASLVGMKEETRKLENQALVNGMRRNGLSEKEKAIEDALMERRKEALDAGVKLEEFATETWKIEEARLATALRTVQAYDEQAAKLDELKKKGNDLVEQAMRGVRSPREQLRMDYSADIEAVKASDKPQAEKDEAYRYLADKLTRDLAEETRHQTDEIVKGLDQLSDAIGGKIGKAINGIANALSALAAAQAGDYSQSGILGGIAQLLSQAKGGDAAIREGASGFMDKMFSKDTWSKPLESMTTSFKGFKDAFNPAAGGSLVKGLGSAIGGAMQGAAIGSAVAGVGKMVWGKFSNTGAQIGGALGSIFGPVGSILGSLGGGIIGGLFKKTKQGGAGLALEDGRLKAGATFGNSGRAKANGSAAAGGIASGVNAIADALGASVTGTGGITIGQYKDDWRVSTKGATSFKGPTKSESTNESRYGLYNFGKDGQDAAIAFAITEALKKGILTGISEFSKRVIKAQGEAGVELARQYENLLKDLGRIKNPLEFGLKEIVTGLDDMAASMKKAGATTEELNNVQEYRALKVKEFIEGELSSLNDFKKALSGDGSGVTSMNRLAASLTSFDTMKADIAAGKMVDQDRFTALGQEIFGLAGDVYGTSTAAFQSIRSMLMEATDGAISNVRTTAETATVTAINTQTAQVVANQSITNDLLREILERVGGNGGASTGGGGIGAVNGRTIQSY